METFDESANYANYYNSGFNGTEPDQTPHADILLATSFIFRIVIVFSLVGNIPVVVMTLFCMRLRSLIAVFMFNLALSDLLNTVTLIFWFHQNIWNSLSGDAACKSYSFVFSAGIFSRFGLMALMSVQHYLVVVRRLSGRKRGRRFNICLIGVWLLSVLAALPGTVHSEVYSTGCLMNSGSLRDALTYTKTTIFLGTSLIAGFCHVKIWQTNFKSPGKQSHETTGLTFCLVATFFICQAPFNIINILNKTISNPSNDEQFYYASGVCEVIAYTLCCWNPVIYASFLLKLPGKAKEICGKQAASNDIEMRNR